MRVLVATPWFPSPAHTGAGIFNLRDAQLIAREHEVRVLHLIRPDWYSVDTAEEILEGIRVLRVPFSAADPRTWPRARRALRQALRGADLVHTMAFPALLPFSGLRVRVPWVHTEHWSGMARVRAGTAGIVDRLLRTRLRSPDETVAVSGALAESIRPWTRRDPHVIGNAVVFPGGGAVSRPVEDGRPLRVVAVGGIAQHKGPLLAVDAVAELVRRGFDIELSWIGEGPQRADLEKQIGELDLGERVVLRGQLERHELELELLAAQVFMLPTAGETFGVAIAEALACGLPVVASGGGGHVEMLGGFEAVRIADRTGPQLAEALLDVLRNDSVERREATVATARSCFSEESRAAAYANVYARSKR